MIKSNKRGIKRAIMRLDLGLKYQLKKKEGKITATLSYLEYEVGRSLEFNEAHTMSIRHKKRFSIRPKNETIAFNA